MTVQHTGVIQNFHSELFPELSPALCPETMESWYDIEMFITFITHQDDSQHDHTRDCLFFIFNELLYYFIIPYNL